MSDLDDALAGFEEMLRGSLEASKRSPRDVITADKTVRMPDEEFDTALWSALCGRIDRGDDIAEWPTEVRAYYSTRMIDWEVANGGFRQALANVPELMPYATSGYELLGRPDLAALLRRAASATDDESLAALDGSLGQNDSERVAFVRANADRFRL